MHYQAEIIINDGAGGIKDLEKLYSALLPEIAQSSRDRSEFSVHKSKKQVKIVIKAKDSVALRATMNNITKLLTVYEKV